MGNHVTSPSKVYADNICSHLLQQFILFSTEANQIGQATFNLNEFILTILPHLALTHLPRNVFREDLFHCFPRNWIEAYMSVGPQIVFPFLSVGVLCIILLEHTLSPYLVCLPESQGLCSTASGSWAPTMSWHIQWWFLLRRWPVLWEILAPCITPSWASSSCAAVLWVH